MKFAIDVFPPFTGPHTTILRPFLLIPCCGRYPSCLVRAAYVACSYARCALLTLALCLVSCWIPGTHYGLWGFPSWWQAVSKPAPGCGSWNVFLVGSLFSPRNTAVQTCCDAVCVPRVSVNPSKLDSPVCTYRTRYVYTLCKAMTSGRCTWGRLSCWWNWWTWFSCACVRVPEMLSSTRCISAHINSTHTYTACTTHYARYVRVRAKAENPFVASSGVKLACDVIQGVVRWRTEWGEWTDR